MKKTNKKERVDWLITFLPLTIILGLCMGFNDGHLRTCRRYFVLFVFGVGSLCHGPPYKRAWQRSGMGRGVPAVSLELYSVGVLSCFGGCIRLYASCSQKKQAKIFGSLQTDFRQTHRRFCRQNHRPFGGFCFDSRYGHNIQCCNAAHGKYYKRDISL